MERLTSTLFLRELTQAEADTPELLPPQLREWQFPYLRADWCWVVEHRDHGPISLIITAPAHGILFFWRLLTTSAARSSTHHLLASLPKILENAKVRGCVGYACFLHDHKPAEVKFARILARHGAILTPFIGTLAVRPLFGVEEAIDAGSGDH